MIKKLHVSNFAIIDDITVEFDDSMTSLTGQTGAGKSLIIDCISLLLGARADSDMIRYGETKAIIEGYFDYKNKKIDELLDKYGIEKNGSLVIKREVSKRSTIMVNNAQVSLNQLKEIASFLADIHVQNDTLKLVNPDNYLNIIDMFSDTKIQDYFNEYTLDLVDYRASLKEYKDALNKNEEVYEKLDLLKFQYDELSKLDLKENELENISKEINVLSNYDRIFNNLNEALEKLDSIDDIYDSFNSLNKIKDYDETYNKYSTDLESAYYTIDDIKSELKKSLNKMDFSKEYLDSLIEREQELKRVSKKYKMEINDLINHISKMKKEIDKCENYDEYVKDCLNDLKKNYDKLLISSKKLEDLREKTGKELSSELIKVCKELDLENINFEVKFTIRNIKDMTNAEFLDSGISDVDFLISLNKGEPVKPLHKVASGGELSRIMLGLKSLLASKQHLSLMVFDEIDSGISGVTASHIAEKIKEISKSTQVLCITHLPHVASIADNQLYISKYEKDGRTFTKVDKLDYNERVKQIAIMISGTKLTEASINSAKELLKA
ncbi:MAG: DNA repair protein RecN [Acholeplasmatales bacterium]|nr:DNA repair protein RecN [Acholeplasmatales bacterium]